MTQEREAVVVVDFENTFIPESEGGTGELGVEGGGKLSPFINKLVNDVRSKGGIIIKTKDYHKRGHMSFASSFKGKKPITEAFANGMNPNPNKNPEFFITYDEVKNWDGNNNGASEGVQFDYERLKAYLKTVGVQAMWPDHGIAGEQSSKIFSGFDSRKDDVTIVKGFVPEEECYSGFGGKELVDQNGEKIKKRTLKEVLDESMIGVVKLVGIATDYCVKATAMDSVKHGFNTTVFTRGTAGVDPAGTIQALEEMRDNGITIID